MSNQASVHSLFPCLRLFEAAIRSDAEALGVLYTGSLGRGTADRFADLDIEVWTAETVFERGAGKQKLRDWMGLLGEIQFIYDRGDNYATGFVGQEWRRTDLTLLREADLEPRSGWAGVPVVKDTNGRLAALVAASSPEAVGISPDTMRSKIEELIDSQIYLALHNARGAVWSALGEVSHQAASTYTLLACLRGRHSYGFRYVEALLSAEEQALLTATWPAAPTRDEVRRAGRALWHWTRYLWSEAERSFGSPLGLTLDEAALLEAVDRIYTW